MYEFNKLYNVDCMTALPTFPDKFFDLAVVDVPYGIGESGADNWHRGKRAKAKDYKAFHGGDKDAPPVEYFRELMRVSRNQIIFGANHFIERIAAVAPINAPCWVVWDKDNGETDFADCELAWTSFPTAVQRFKFRWSGMLQGNMKDKEARIHPTQKPVALYKWILQKYAKEGDKILDTHAGSASSGIACYDLGLDWTGFEIDAHYYALAAERLETHKAQLRFADYPADAGGSYPLLLPAT